MDIKKKLILALGAAVMLSCTGCGSGMTWEEMKEEGANLMQQGAEMNEKLASEAAEMNASILSAEIDLKKGWKTIFEKENLQIQYAEATDIDTKNVIEDSVVFVEKLQLEEWELVDDFPENVDSEVIYFIQEPVAETMQNDEYKNIANMRCLPDEGYVMITIGQGLIDLSDTFEPEQNSYTSVYKIPEEVISFLQEYEKDF